VNEQQTWQILSTPVIPSGRLFLSVPELSALLGYDRLGRTVRKGIEAGEIPATRVGATWRIPVAWIREQARLDATGGADAA
jgi:excisionase family DNA binding protein